MGLYHATLWFRLFLVTCACRSLSCCMDARHGTLACMERDTHARLTAFPSRRLLNCDRDAALFVVDELERQCERCLYFTGERGKTTALMLKSEDHQAKWKKERGERLQKRGESNMSRKIGSRNAFSLLVPCGRATERIGGMLRLRGGLEVFWRPASLIKTKEWLEATTLDGSPVESRFDFSSCPIPKPCSLSKFTLCELRDRMALKQTLDSTPYAGHNPTHFSPYRKL